MLIHGYTGNSRNWALTVPALSESFSTISVDLRGHGFSAKPSREEDHSLELMAEDVHGLLKQLGVEECYLAGHSMGGMVSQLLVLSHPETVRALVLVDTAAEIPKGFCMTSDGSSVSGWSRSRGRKGWRRCSKSSCGSLPSIRHSRRTHGTSTSGGNSS